jgi:transposase
LLCEHEGWSQRRVAEKFSNNHPGKSVNLSSVGRLLKKFQATGSVTDKPQAGRPSIANGFQEVIISKVHASPKNQLDEHLQS